MGTQPSDQPLELAFTKESEDASVNLLVTPPARQLISILRPYSTAERMPVKTILITGASSGIGAALARTSAKPGVQLALWGQNAVRLETTAAACRAAGASVESTCFDLTDLDQLTDQLEAVDSHHPLDLAIFNAGLGGSLDPAIVTQDRRSAERMTTVNFTVPVICANLLGGRMAGRGHGRIVLVGSAADSFPLPMAPVYAGTKAGLALFADALELRLARYGVGVTLVVPGFVDTPMSQGLTEPKPFLVSAEAAAAIIARKLDHGAKRIVLPWQFVVIRVICGLLPRVLVRAVFRLAWRSTSA